MEFVIKFKYIQIPNNHAYLIDKFFHYIQCYTNMCLGLYIFHADMMGYSLLHMSTTTIKYFTCYLKKKLSNILRYFDANSMLFEYYEHQMDVETTLCAFNIVVLTFIQSFESFGYQIDIETLCAFNLVRLHTKLF